MNRISVPKTIAFIFARGGSQGLSRKALRTLNKKPLISYPIHTARQCPEIDRVIVSTDDEEIASVAASFGAEIPFIRPSHLTTDTAPEWLSWRHAVETLRAQEGNDSLSVFVSLPSTSPLRSPHDVQRCLKLYSAREADLIVTATPAHRNPYFNMVSLDSHHTAHLMITPASSLSRRQDAPQAYDLTTVCYVTSPEIILKHSSLWQCRVKAVLIPPERSVDIDTELDLSWAEFLVQSGRVVV